MIKTRRLHHALPLAIAILASGLIAACDSPTQPAPQLMRVDRLASEGDDSTTCISGYIVINGVVYCN